MAHIGPTAFSRNVQADPGDACLALLGVICGKGVYTGGGLGFRA